MKVLGICGSPRKGNTEWMLTRVLEASKATGADVELLLLRDKDIRLCKGCLKCEVPLSQRPGVCVIKDDDMGPMLEKILAADVLVFGTPVYLFMLSGTLKNFIDRCCPVWPLLKGKKMAGVVVAEDSIGAAMDNLKTFADGCSLEWAGEVTALARMPGDVAKNGEVAVMLAALGRALAVSG